MRSLIFKFFSEFTTEIVEINLLNTNKKKPRKSYNDRWCMHKQRGELFQVIFWGDHQFLIVRRKGKETEVENSKQSE